MLLIETKSGAVITDGSQHLLHPTAWHGLLRTYTDSCKQKGVLVYEAG